MCDVSEHMFMVVCVCVCVRVRVSACHLLWVWGQLWRQFGPRVPSILCLHLFLTTHRTEIHKHIENEDKQTDKVCTESSVPED